MPFDVADRIDKNVLSPVVLLIFYFFLFVLRMKCVSHDELAMVIQASSQKAWI